MTTENQAPEGGPTVKESLTAAYGDKWEGAEEWMPLAWELCANECGEEACTELIWEGGPIPEPWGDRWMKYEDQAKEMIAMVRKHVPAPAPAEGDEGELRAMLQKLGFGPQCAESIGITLLRWKDGYSAALESQAQPKGAEPVASQMPLVLRLRVLADQIKRNDGLRDNAAKDHRTLIEAADALAAAPSPAVDVERLIRDVLPGGHSCDPQAVADDIRAWFASPAAPAQQAAWWLMTAGDGDTSADWVERGPQPPEPMPGFRAVALVAAQQADAPGFSSGVSAQAPGLAAQLATPIPNAINDLQQENGPQVAAPSLTVGERAEWAPWSKSVESASLLLNRATALPLDECEGLARAVLSIAHAAQPAAQAEPVAPYVATSAGLLVDGRAFAETNRMAVTDEWISGWNALRAALASQPAAHAPQVPAGMALVPVEPTDAMCAACTRVLEADDAPTAWAAMLAAAPASKAPAVGADPLESERAIDQLTELLDEFADERVSLCVNGWTRRRTPEAIRAEFETALRAAVSIVPVQPTGGANG